jgi:predicted SAM-dependent methyltransferase
MRLEIGAGERPDPTYDIHVDLLALPDIEVVCQLDRLPFPTGILTALRANHVLEHQSWELVEPTLREWARVLKPGAEVYIGVPDARFIASEWVSGALDTAEANYWILGGHSERDAHKGVDTRGVPKWIWNAHHTLFDEDSLRLAVEAAGFVDVEISRYAVRNLRCDGVRGEAR